MCVCVCVCFFFWGGGGGGGGGGVGAKKAMGGMGVALQLIHSHGPPNRTASYIGYINSSGVHGGLSFTVKYCYYFTKTKELNV